MQKKNEEIKPAFSRNLNTLLLEQKITGKELAEMIHTSEQTISKARNGIRLTKDLAESIINLFPQYNITWLLGYTQIPTKKESEELIHKAALATVKNAMIKEQDFISGIVYIAKYCGLEAEYNEATLSLHERIQYYPDEAVPGIDLDIASECEELFQDITAFMKYRLQKAIDRGH